MIAHLSESFPGGTTGSPKLALPILGREYEIHSIHCLIMKHQQKSGKVRRD
jgi:hypothetical protein